MNRTILTDKDIRIGVWTFGDVNTDYNFAEFCFSEIPDNIFELDKLWINVGAWTGLPEKTHKSRRKEWIKLMPLLKNIKYLWVKGSINQEFFDRICDMKWLNAIWLDGLISIRNLNQIENLKNLLHLSIASSSKLDNIKPLSKLTNLITLQIEGFKLVTDISPITKITTLKGLHIKGDMWKKQFIQSLKGIENLQDLEYLSLDGTEVIEKDVKPVTKLVKLKNLELGYWWTENDLKLAYNALPLLEYGGVKEAVESGEYEKYLRKMK